MNTSPRRAVLAATVVLGLFVGIWAAFFRRSFFDDFPGFGLHWISLAGPDDEHLVSDVGDAYLAFAALSAAGLVSARATAGRMAGLAWTVFGVLHLAFHATHPMGDSLDVAGTLVSLTVAALLGVALLVLPVRVRAAGPVAP